MLYVISLYNLMCEKPRTAQRYKPGDLDFVLGHRWTAAASTTSSGQLKGMPVPALIDSTPGPASAPLEDGVRRLSLGHRIFTNMTAPPMQAPAVPFPDAGMHVALPDEFRPESQAGSTGSD